MAGAVFAPLIAGLMRGRGLGSVLNILLGAAVGVGAGYGIEQLGYGRLLGGVTSVPELGYVQDLIEGGVAGGLLGIVLGLIRRH